VKCTAYFTNKRVCDHKPPVWFEKIAHLCTHITETGGGTENNSIGVNQYQPAWQRGYEAKVSLVFLAPDFLIFPMEPVPGPEIFPTPVPGTSLAPCAIVQLIDSMTIHAIKDYFLLSQIIQSHNTLIFTIIFIVQ